MTRCPRNPPAGMPSPRRYTRYTALHPCPIRSSSPGPARAPTHPRNRRSTLKRDFGVSMSWQRRYLLSSRSSNSSKPPSPRSSLNVVPSISKRCRCASSQPMTIWMTSCRRSSVMPAGTQNRLQIAGLLSTRGNLQIEQRPSAIGELLQDRRQLRQILSGHPRPWFRQPSSPPNAPARPCSAVRPESFLLANCAKRPAPPTS